MMAQSPEDTATSKYRIRLNQLRQDQDTWRPHWKEIADYMLPRKGKYLDGDTDNKAVDGAKRDQLIINGSANDALRIIAAGMQGGLTSPSRPWFMLTLADKELMESAPVRRWLDAVRNTMLLAFARSNFYSAIHGMYKELAAFGTAAQMIEEDFASTIRCRPFTIGEYLLSLDSTYRPNVLYRQVSLTARQMRQMYGEDKLSEPVKAAIKANMLENRFEVIHCIEPNSGLDSSKADARGMKYESISFEKSCDHDKFLKKSGYRTLPFVAPRWDVAGVDVYGSSPGMEALGDVKMLQKMEEKKLKALDKLVDPPMNAPSSMKAQGGTVVAGGVNYIDIASGQQGFSPAYMINPNIQQMEMSIERVEMRIRKFFFNDMFLSIIANEKVMTATEVARRHEEKLMMLGPVLERLQSEMLDPIVERVFDIHLAMNMLPPAPPEISGMDIKVEYISLLAQAQKMIGTSAIEQTVGFASNMAAVNPDVLDKIDFDEVVDQYSEMVGVAAKIIRSDDEVAALRAQREKARQGQMALAAGQSMADTAKTLSDTKMEDDTALAGLMGGNGGLATQGG